MVHCCPQVFASGTLFTLGTGISATSPVTQPSPGATFTATFSAEPPTVSISFTFGVAVYTQCGSALDTLGVAPVAVGGYPAGAPRDLLTPTNSSTAGGTGPGPIGAPTVLVPVGPPICFLAPPPPPALQQPPGTPPPPTAASPPAQSPAAPYGSRSAAAAIRGTSPRPHPPFPSWRLATISTSTSAQHPTHTCLSAATTRNAHATAASWPRACHPPTATSGWPSPGHPYPNHSEPAWRDASAGTATGHAQLDLSTSRHSHPGDSNPVSAAPNHSHPHLCNPTWRNPSVSAATATEHYVHFPTASGHNSIAHSTTSRHYTHAAPGRGTPIRGRRRRHRCRQPFPVRFEK